MLRYIIAIASLAALVVASGARVKMTQPCDSEKTISIYNAASGGVEQVRTMHRTDEEWRRLLTPEQFDVTRLKGTERPFSATCAVPMKGESGTYQCVGCGTDLFKYNSKFDSGTGWPSFWEPISKLNVRYEADDSGGRERTEVLCARCGAHLGHVFDDGPEPTGKRFCINSVALKLSKTVHYEKATFAAGCFWGVESAFRELLDNGVKSTRVGYTGGHTKNPTYEDVCSHTTGHAEAVEIIYDPAKITYDDLLKVFWSIHDPTTPNRQGPDVGSNYRSAVFYHTPKQQAAAEKSKEELAKSKQLSDPIVTEIVKAGEFYPAEEYHQQYFEKKGIKPTCRVPL